MDLIFIKINKSILRIIFFIFYLLRYYLCFIQKINVRKEEELKNNISSKKELLSFRKTSELQQSKIFGNINELNYYYINLYLGNNKKKQSFLLDTGSGITSIPCKPYCNQCGQHINSYLYIDESQIIKCNSEKCSSVESICNEDNNFCSFEIRYSENSDLKGIYFNEIINFSSQNKNMKNKNLIPIGCTIYEDNLFYTQKVDGIIGLCNNGNNFINILYKYKIIHNNIFSLCFGQKGGYISIDRIETKYHKESIKYINIDKNNNYYSFNINKIKINDNTISNKTYIGIIDSGLTLTKMPINIANKIINYFKNICNLDENNMNCGEYFTHKELDLCFRFNSTEELNYIVNNIWPNITFIINDYKYVWKPSQYLFNFIENEKIIGCFGLIKDRANIFNLGASWMIGHDIIFNNENNKIGFAEADCNQNDLTNNGEEDEEKPLYNDNINILENDLGKKLFIFYIIIIFILIFILILFCICILYLRKGKNFLCIGVRTNVENDFFKNNFQDNDINKKIDKLSSFIEMNNNFST